MFEQININFIEKDLSRVLDSIAKGKEIILTKSDIPIARVTPIDNKELQTKRNFLKARTIETRRAFRDEASENWFG